MEKHVWAPVETVNSCLFFVFFLFNVSLTELIAWLHLPEALLSSSQLMVWTMMALHALLFRRWRCTICLLIGCCRSLPVDLLKIREDKKTHVLEVAAGCLWRVIAF